MLFKVQFIHLFNNYTGSPLVLRNSITVAKQMGADVLIHTNTSTGFLSAIPEVSYNHLSYVRCKNKWLTLCYLIYAQLQVFFRVLFSSSKDLIYINSVLPFGALLASFFKSNRVILHLHENRVSPPIFNTFLFSILRWSKAEIVPVSYYLAQNPYLKNKKVRVIHNCVTEKFELQAMKFEPSQRMNEKFQVLMLASLRTYKGVNVFLKLASLIPNADFVLVLSDSSEDVEAYFKVTPITKNVKLVAVTEDVHLFYRNAHLILNLSLPDQWVETFGMTILEGMYYHLPAIVPPVGGICELVEDGLNGFQISAYEPERIAEKIQLLMKNESMYKRMADNAFLRRKLFGREIFAQKVKELLH